MSYLKFQEAKVPGNKLSQYTVHNSSSGVVLGKITFYGAWRKFTFTPCYEIIFDAVCLHEIAQFLEAKTKEWRDSL